MVAKRLPCLAARFEKMDVLELLASRGAMIARLVSDSRGCAPGAAFFAYPGEAADGRRYIPDAIGRGATAVLWEAEDFSWNDAWRVPNVAVSGLKRQAGHLAHRFHGRPSEAMWVCGVTGTNGKTTCSQWIAALLTAQGAKSGVIGTLGAGFPAAPGEGATGALRPLSNTTPDALELHLQLALLAGEGAQCVALEASSHGLEQGRLNGVAFDCALFTNLTHEHLDYHGSFDAYAAAKERLFDSPGLQAAVINLDDATGERLAHKLRARGLRTIGYGLSPDTAARARGGEHLAATRIQADDAGTGFEVSGSWGAGRATIAHVGRFNVANALGVLGCLLARGCGLEDALRSLCALPAVPGRMQRFGGVGEPLVVVDYAHTPDALENVLRALRPLAEERGGGLVAVFGAGGGRDPTKRAPMGEVAARLADRVMLTSDNPRDEAPAAIIAAIRAGMAASGSHCDVESGRGAAIGRAIGEADPRDVVLIAGKGHESWQEISGRRQPFSDAQAALDALARRGSRP